MATQDDAPTRQQDDFFTVLGNAFRLIGKSWDALTLNLATFVLIGLVPVTLFILAIVLPLGATSLLDGSSDISRDTNAAPVNVALILLGIILVISVVWATVASLVTQLASVRGQKIAFKDAVNRSTPFLLRFVGLGLATAVLIILGLVLLIIPGILAAFFLSFSTYLMIDKNLGVVESIKGSYELVKQNWKLVLSYYLVSVVISLPQIVPVLGVIASLALSIAYFCLPAILYVRAQKAPSAA